jgi:hypothetical protein
VLEPRSVDVLLRVEGAEEVLPGTEDIGFDIEDRLLVGFRIVLVGFDHGLDLVGRELAGQRLLELLEALLHVLLPLIDGGGVELLLHVRERLFGGRARVNELAGPQEVLAGKAHVVLGFEGFDTAHHDPLLIVGGKVRVGVSEPPVASCRSRAAMRARTSSSAISVAPSSASS